MIGMAALQTKFSETNYQDSSSQARCLAIDWKRLRDCDAQIEALCGLIIAEAALGATEDDLDNLMEFLVQRVDGILHEDGGHKSQCLTIT